MTDLSSPNRPPSVRPALPEDADAIGHLLVRAWRAAYRGRVSDDYLERLDPVTRARQWKENIARSTRTVLVSEDDGAVVGFCSLARCSDADLGGRRTGEITALYVEPDHWRRGHGRALATAAEMAATREGFEQLVLWVLHTNDAAFAFYAALGFEPDGAERMDGQLGVDLRVVRYRLRAVP